MSEADVTSRERAGWRATEAVLRGEIRRAESALAAYDELAARLARVAALVECIGHQVEDDGAPSCFRCVLDAALTPASAPDDAEGKG